MKRNTSLWLALFLFAAVRLAGTASAPIYDEKVDARQQIAAAIAEASRSGKNVLLNFGANW